MRLDGKALNKVPIGRFRIQILSTEQSPKLARLVRFAHFFISELGGTWRTRSLSRSARTVQKHEEIDYLKENAANEFEVRAVFPTKSRGCAHFGIREAWAHLAVSPTSSLWADTESWKGKGKAEIRRLNYRLCRKFVQGRGFDSYPSLLDMLVFRSKSRTEQDGKLFFALVIKGLAHVGVDLVQCAFGDFNRRTDDALAQVEKAHARPGDLGMTLDQGHQILVVSEALSRKLKAAIDPNQFIEVKALSDKLTAILFADDFLASQENRRLFRQFIS